MNIINSQLNRVTIIMNKKTALVYGGAAVLIVVFGVRTLARTIEGFEDYEGALTLVTGLALILEFSLLMMYAYSIYIQPDSLGSTSANQVLSSNTDHQPAVDKLDNINSNLNDFTDQMEEVKNHLAIHNAQIEKLNENLGDIFNEQLDNKIKEQLSKLLRK